MYKILYDNDFLFDPFDDSRVVYNASITNNINAASYLDFTVTSAHPMYDKIEERSGIITVYWDNEELFQGQITKIELDLDGNKTVACSSALDWLREVQLRPYSTDEAECKEYEFPLDKAPESLDGYFQWVIDQYNATNLDDRRFDIDVNQANGLTSKNHVYFASTSPQTVADAIESNILDAYGGYLVLRYDDHRLVLDLYSDIHEMNPQIIDFAENILDITKTEDTNDQYTAVLPLGKSPQYTAKQQKYHDEKDAYDKRMKERDAAQKSKIDRLRKEEEAERKRIDGIKDKKAKKAAQDALKRRQDARQKDEDAFRKETERLQNEQKIKDDANNADKTKTNPIDISSLPDGGLPTDLDLYKKGDVVYSMTAVERYGYKEYVYTDNEVEDKQELLKLAGVMLRKLMAPALSIDVKAIDRALYQPEHTHLFVGQAVRVRSKIHGVDEFMMVSSLKINLTDPSQTTATLGVVYDTLTGQQSSYLKSLNSQIDASVDVVTKVENNVKNTEITLGQVQQVVSNVNDKTDLVINNVGDYKWQTDVAWDSANEAQNTADEANEKADVNKESINNLKTEVDTSKAETDEAIGQMSNEMAAIAQKAEDIRTDVNAVVESVRGDLAETDTKAQDAATKAQQAMDGLTDANTKIEGLETSVDRNTEAITNANGEIVGVKKQITGVATTANNALSVATTNTQSLKEQSNRIDTAYSEIESARTTISEVKQTADGVKLNLETNYLDKTQTAAAYVTKAQLTATSEQISTSVSKKYATIETVEGLQNIADAAIETWSGQVNPTNSNPPASTWTTDALKRQHTGDIYYNMDTGKSYRWGSTDGTSYSWVMIADNDITKALADAAKAQATAEGAKTDVANLSNKVKAEYVSNSTFNQTAESIRASVTEAASTANAASEKAAALEVRANGIDATLREQASTLNNHTTTIGQLSVKADGLQGKFEQSVDMANLTNGRGDNFIVDPGFENAKYWNLNGSTLSVGKSDNSHTGSNCMRVAGSIKSSIPLVHPYGDTSESAQKMVSVIPGHRYRMSFWFKSSASCTVNTANNKLRISDTNDTVIEACDAFPVSTTYVQRTKDWVCPANITSVYLKWNMEITSGEYWIDDISFIDVTADAKGSEALTKTATLEAGLNGFKQTVEETYTTKTETQYKINAIAIGSVNYCKYGDYQNAVNGITGLAYDRATNIYEFDIPTTVSSSWGGGIGARNESSNKMTIPWGEWGTLTFDVYASAECVVKSDINNWFDGSSSNANDLRSRMTLCPPSASLVLESSTASGIPSFRIPANTWVRLGFSIYNGNTSTNPNKKDIRSYTNILCIPKSAVYHVKVRNIKFERGNKPTAWSPAPDDMLDKTTAQETYSTKSYVDQTAESVSIGVVEGYKNGEHGDKLTTSSQLQAMKDSITSTVASTYESKSDATLKGKAIDGLINPDFTTGTTYGWSGQNYVGRISTSDTSVGGPYLVCERFTPNSQFRINNDGVITVKPGNTYRVSANLRASHDFIQNNLGVALRKADDTLISFHQIAVRADFDAAGNVWTYRYVDIKIPDKITAIKIGFGSDVTSAAGHFIIKGLRIEDVTLALAAQDTANKGMKQSSEAIQSLEKFQQSVEETYVKGEDLSGGSTNILIDTKAFGNANPNGATNGLPGALGFPTNTSHQGLTIREIPASNTSANQVICEYAIKDCQGGQWYTASFFAKGSGTFRAFFRANGNVVESKTVANDSYSGVTTTSGGDGCAEIKVDGRWRRYNVSWRLDPKNTSVFEKRFLLRRDATSGNIAVCGVKLEKGTIPSDWSPSPFDLAQQTSLNGELTKYTEKTTFEQTKNSFEWNIKSLAKYGPDKIPNGDPRSDLETIMAIEKDSNPPVYTFTVNNTSAPYYGITVSRNRFALTSALIANRTYRFSFEARVVSGSVPSADYIKLVCSNDDWSGYYPWLDGSGLSTTWKTFTKVIKVTQNCTKGAIEYTAKSTGAKKFYIRNVSIMDVTEGADAQSGVNELDTLIRYTSNGIEVGHKTNGQYTGPKALVNSNGSFDVVKADNTLVSRFGENLMGIMRDPTLNDYRYSLSTFISPAAGGGKERRGVNMKSYGSFMLNGIPCNAATDMIDSYASNDASIPTGSSNGWFYLKMDLKSLQGKTFTVTNAATFRSDYYKKVDAINNGTTTTAFDSRYFDHCLCCATANNNSSDTSVTAGAQRQVMITSPGLYGIIVHVHGFKPNTANSAMEVVVEQMPATASSYSIAPNMRFRIFEVSDRGGYIQKQTPIVFNKFDVGTRLRIGFQASHSGFKLSTWSKVYIVRMPFSSIIS